MIKYIYWNSCFGAVYVSVCVWCMNICGCACVHFCAHMWRPDEDTKCPALLFSPEFIEPRVPSNFNYICLPAPILQPWDYKHIPNTPGFLLRSLRFGLRSSQQVHLPTEPTSQLLDLHFKKKIVILKVEVYNSSVI